MVDVPEGKAGKRMRYRRGCQEASEIKQVTRYDGVDQAEAAQQAQEEGLLGDELRIETGGPVGSKGTEPEDLIRYSHTEVSSRSVRTRITEKSKSPGSATSTKYHSAAPLQALAPSRSSKCNATQLLGNESDDSSREEDAERNQLNRRPAAAELHDLDNQSAAGSEEKLSAHGKQKWCCVPGCSQTRSRFRLQADVELPQENTRYEYIVG